MGMKHLISAMTMAMLALAVMVKLPQEVTADGKPLPAGSYEIRVTEQRPALPSGEPNETQRWVEFVSNGVVVGREIAEVFPASERPVGTAGANAVVQTLKGGEFLRVSFNERSARYLIHFPVGAARGPQ